MSVSSPSAQSEPGADAGAAGCVLGASLIWATASTVTLVVVAVVAGGGFFAVNLIVVGIVLIWGPVLGSLAGGIDVMATLLLRRLLPTWGREVVAALLGWGAAFTAWALLTFGGAEASMIVGSAVVAGLGVGVNVAVRRRCASSRRGSVALGPSWSVGLRGSRATSRARLRRSTSN